LNRKVVDRYNKQFLFIHWYRNFDHFKMAEQYKIFYKMSILPSENTFGTKMSKIIWY